ncbi:LysM domain-containing protein [Desulfosporosinus sp. BICA1-9]|uniref:LysM peptidoglycan-binding domain-containing protein n=1 Tax=Desulfosporosinus sp. BICA1-9 TaxID=1531958 RepID=UPI000A48BD65|nr:LysM domain-containing protein [Desulfosporosinus sp. BICA1-9]
MGGKEYCIQPGDNFHDLAQRWGGTCEDFLLVNPSVDPMKLQIGQKIVLPEFKSALQGQEQFADIRKDQGQGFVGDYLDEVEMEVEGVRVRLRRIGEPRVPHEIHFILPRTEIRKIQPAGECGPTDVQIMLSNLDVVLSPRLVSGNGDRAEQGKLVVSPDGQTQAQPQIQAQPQAQAQSPTQKTVQGENESPQLQFGATPPYDLSAQTATQPSQGLMQGKNQPRWRMSFPFN